MIINQNKKMNIGLYLAVLTIIMILIVVMFIIYKYHVEGEAIPSFKINKMLVVSTAKTENLELIEGLYSADVVQNNDIRIAIEKNPKYKKEAIIKKVIINNIKIDSRETDGNIQIYRPSTGAKAYEYIEQYKVNNYLEYIGTQETNLKSEQLQIANQGGIIDLSVVLNNIGKIQYKENEPLKVDGTLLKQMGINEISYQVRFDLIIELENDIKLKTKITIDLPTGNILEDGIETLEETNMKTIFKRI